MINCSPFSVSIHPSIHFKSHHILPANLHIALFSSYLDLDQGPDIGLMRDREIVSYAKQDDSTKDQDTIIHCHPRRWRCRWPETEEDDNSHESTSYNVVRGAPVTRDFERTPV